MENVFLRCNAGAITIIASRQDLLVIYDLALFCESFGSGSQITRSNAFINDCLVLSYRHHIACRAKHLALNLGH
ncbi:hypothetical protein Plhal710r2_c010g0046081 [Plasmopara halstedii]